MYSTSEAAKLLSVSTRRVTKMLADGQLEGEKISGVWLVDEDSVQKRLSSHSNKPGRPKLGERAAEVKFVLFNKTYPVLSLVYDSKLKTFTHITETLDERRVPVGISTKKGEIKIWDFNSWWSGRGIPQSRRNIEKILVEAGVFVPEELLMRNLGLTLSDQWWICPDGAALSWEDINFFGNDFESMAYQNGIMKGVHPNNTSDGNLEKFWTIENGKRMLYKQGSGLCQEPFNEVVATRLHRRLLTPCEFVPYELAEKDNLTWSVCPNFLKNNEEFIPATWVSKLYVKKNHESEHSHYVNCCEMLGAENVQLSLSHMIICDSLLSNTDRHFRNFGLVRNVDTLECRPAPIFDSGNSLWFDVSNTDLKKHTFKTVSKQFYENTSKQLLLVDDFSILSPENLEGFVEEAISVLAKNPLLSGRIALYEKLLTERINHLLTIANFN